MYTLIDRLLNRKLGALRKVAKSISAEQYASMILLLYKDLIICKKKCT